MLQCLMRNITPKIAKYIKNHRLSLRRTQKEMALDAGISLMTLRRAESGEVISLETLIALMDVFGELENFERLFFLQENTPRDLLKAKSNPKSKPRSRVRKRKNEDKKEWVWGDSEK